MKKNRGFSLVEVLAVTVIMVFIFSALYSFIFHVLRDSHVVNEQTELRNSANTVMAAIQKDLLKAKRSPDGQDSVKATSNRLEIVTSWKEPSNPSTQYSPSNVVVYTIYEDPVTKQKNIYRYAGPPSTLLGMKLGGYDVDYRQSVFTGPNQGLITVSLNVKGKRTEYSTTSSFRIEYGS